MASSSAISGPIPPPRSLPVKEPLPASNSLALKYRGATVEDLQLSPAVCIPTTATIDSALQVAFDHDYEQLPVLSNSNGNRKLLGYLDVKKLRADVEASKLQRNESVLKNMVKFGGSSVGKDKNTYTLISPETGLGELEGEFSTSKMNLNLKLTFLLFLLSFLEYDSLCACHRCITLLCSCCRYKRRSIQIRTEKGIRRVNYNNV